MPQIDPAFEAERFTLYVEGPRDRGILRAWAYRLMPTQARRLFGDAVILGGRRPARAIDHFDAARRGGSGRALCVLDRDDGAAPPTDAPEGLEFFTWSRRHIESYLLVPGAIRRAMGLREDDRRVEHVLAEHLGRGGEESAWRTLDAKRLLGPKGALPRALGRALPLAQIARATREAELHPDVHALFGRLRRGLDGQGGAHVPLHR